MMGLPNFNELARQAQEFMAVIQAAQAELRALRLTISQLTAQQQQMSSELAMLRGQVQRMETACQTISSLNNRKAA